MFEVYQPRSDVDVIMSVTKIPTLGSIAINSFLLNGEVSVLVDTGFFAEDMDEFVETVGSLVDLQSLKYIYLSHPHGDHTGGLSRLLAANSELRVITAHPDHVAAVTSIIENHPKLRASMQLSVVDISSQLPIGRTIYLKPGETITLGDRRLTAYRPPVFDNAYTIGFYEQHSELLFTSDFFGALLPRVPRSAADLSDEELRAGQGLWASIDSPWIHGTDERLFQSEMERMRLFQPGLVLSSHLPAASGQVYERMLQSLDSAPRFDRYTGPSTQDLLATVAQPQGSTPS